MNMLIKFYNRVYKIPETDQKTSSSVKIILFIINWQIMLSVIIAHHESFGGKCKKDMILILKRTCLIMKIKYATLMPPLDSDLQFAIYILTGASPQSSEVG